MFNRETKSMKLTRMFLVFVLLFAAFPVFAQNRTVSGTVVDEVGEPIIGANVMVVGQKGIGAITNLDGEFQVSAPSGATLEVSFMGYLTKRVKMTNETKYQIVLAVDAVQLSETVVVGYGTQKKATLTGAISQISSEEMIATKNQNAQNMLTGKIPGVRVVQKTSEPGEFNNQFDIRGFGSPLIVIDGVPGGDVARLDPNEIESMSVLKDASAAIYGVRAANGVVLITTKKGERNRTKVEYNMYYGIQTPAEILKPVDAIDRMTLFNEKTMRNIENPYHKYPLEQIELYKNGTLKSTDWYDAILKNTAPQQSHNISVSGGGEKVDYFISLGYMDQKGFFATDDLDYNRFNLRSNINAQVTENLRLGVKLSGMLDDRTGHSKDSWEIFKNLWRSVPSQPIYANNTFPYYQDPESADDHPLALITSEDSGYKKRGNRRFNAIFDGEYNIPGVEGLSLRGMFSYNTSVSDNSTWTKEHKIYNYNEAADSYDGTSRLGPTKLDRSYGSSYSTLWQASINYDNTFGKHHVSGLVLYEESHGEGDNIQASRYFTIPLPYLFAGNSKDQVGTANAGGITESARKSLVGRVNYDFGGKYLAEFSFRYDGSSLFPAGKQWGFFPAGSLGWRISEESFIKDSDALSFINNLKLRSSYGVMGDDGSAAYQFISGYDYPNTSGGAYDKYPTGYMFGGGYTNSLGFRPVPNPNITWYTVKTMNVGIDLDMWNGLLGVTAEYFQRHRDGLLADRLATIPGTFGSTMPKENLNSDSNMGFEVEVRHHNRIGEFRYDITANVALTRGMRNYYETNPAGNSYQYWRNYTLNRYNDIWFGYGAAGRFTDYEQIANNMYAGNGTLPGDYIYEDWNQDGTIDDGDRHPIATTTNPTSSWQDKSNIPLLNFGLTLAASWKGIDINMLFQGSGMSYIAYGEQLKAPLQFDGNALDMFLDRWRPVDPSAHPYDPNTEWISGYYSYGATSPDENSEFMIQKGDYLRLKSLEIGYSLPKKWLKHVKIQKVRLYFNAYNLLTLTNVKGVDPEKPTQLYGYMYPLNKTYNFGVNLSF